ncbi:TolC family protein [Butyricimonas synergistica]|uniref:TolC family protein n=1 Tax=Butyricimonas synergistica TaxID=544644 RepID=UPI000368D61D|nr:TolC family protein [Butyricimonas synergistica]
MMKKILTISVTILSLTACNVYEPYTRPKIQAENLYGMEYFPEDTLSMVSLSWKEIFTDTLLQDYIEKALSQNVDVRSAQLRIDEAKAQLSAARLTLLPSFALTPQSHIRSLNGEKATQAYQLPVTANWQIDIFGRLSNAKKQAKALFLQSQDYAQAVRSQLVANVANTYYTLMMLDRQLDIAKSTKRSWLENLASTRTLKSIGGATEIAVSQSEAACQFIAISILDLQEQIKQVENSFCLLLAEVPHSIKRNCIKNQYLPTSVKIGIPMQLLITRPDVRAAERSLENAFYATNQARSDFYPNITLNGTAGWTNAAGELIVNPGSFLVLAIGSLVQPLFANGRLTARLKVAKSLQERATLNFQQALLNAGTEVNDALCQYQTAHEKSKLYEQQIAFLNAIVRNTELLMSYGNTTYLEVLTARQSLYNAELNQVANQMKELQSVVNLYQALGGGV